MFAMRCSTLFPFYSLKRYERFANRHIAAKSIGFQCFERMHETVVSLYSIDSPSLFLLSTTIIFDCFDDILPFHVVHITQLYNSN